MAALITLSLGNMTTISVIQKSTPPGTEDEPGFQITIQSATIEGESTTVSIFESAEPAMTFLWLEPNESINGG
jgi:hypothetical protein